MGWQVASPVLPSVNSVAGWSDARWPTSFYPATTPQRFARDRLRSQLAASELIVLADEELVRGLKL